MQACEECSEYAVLTAGTCDPCRGRGEFAPYCSACNSTKGPEFCVACRDLNGEQDSGVYADAQGECKLCPLKGCTACTSAGAAGPGGECTSCSQAQGLVGGVCVPCKDQDNCDSCDGAAERCTSCSQGFFANATGLCAPCLANCTLCSSATTCDTCTAGTAWDAAKGACTPCEQEVRERAGGRCAVRGPRARRRRCRPAAFALMRHCAASACRQACVDCTAPGSCSACDSGWRLTNGTCLKW